MQVVKLFADNFVSVFRSVDRVKLDEADIAKFNEGKLGGGGLNAKVESVQAVIRYMKWRKKALRLAVVMSFITIILTLVGFVGKWASLNQAKGWCDGALVDIELESPTRRLKSEDMFSNRYGYNATDTGTCEYISDGAKKTFGSLSPNSQDSTMLLDHSSKNQLCGAFAASCTPVLENSFKLKFENDPASVSTDDIPSSVSCAQGSIFCGRDGSESKCPYKTELERRLVAGCHAVYCRASTGYCPAGSPCAGRVYCGFDDFGPVCATSQAQCESISSDASAPAVFEYPAALQRFRKLLVSIGSDGYYGYTREFYSSKQACETGMEYSAQNYIDGTFPTNDVNGALLSREMFLGTAELGDEFTDATVLAAAGIDRASSKTYQNVMRAERAYSSQIYTKTFNRVESLRACGCSTDDRDDDATAAAKRETSEVIFSGKPINLADIVCTPPADTADECNAHYGGDRTTVDFSRNIFSLADDSSSFTVAGYDYESR
jgi:hypothetical protein